MKVSLIIFLIGFFTISPAIYMGIKYFDGKVTEHPYETGLKYNKEQKTVKDSGLALDAIESRRDGDDVKMEFALEKKPGVNLDGTAFFVTRPASDKQLIQIKVNPRGNGVYESEFTVRSRGYHVLKMMCRVHGEDIVLQKSFYID